MLGKFDDTEIVSSDEEFEIKEEGENVELSGVIAYNKTDEKKPEVVKKEKTIMDSSSSDDGIVVEHPDKEDSMAERK